MNTKFSITTVAKLFILSVATMHARNGDEAAITAALSVQTVRTLRLTRFVAMFSTFLLKMPTSTQMTKTPNATSVSYTNAAIVVPAMIETMAV